MQPIRFDAHTYYAGEQPIYLLSGEFHYFRVPRADWRRRMQLFKQAGGNCLATYVPWLLHEPQEGDFRFSGADWLDLEGFLQAAQEEDLYVIARPGPYQYSELVYHGLPGWLVKTYPEVLAQTLEGKPIGYASISYTHPLFLEKVRRWFDAVLPILARYTVEQGGPVAFVQIDNEMVGIHEWFGSLDYHPLTMGFGLPDGKYPRFLKERYGSIEVLNQAYETGFCAFESVLPGTAKGALALLRQKKDYFDFYLGTIADYSQTLVDMIRAHGIQTPIVHNAANPEMNAYFLETARRLGPSFLLGSDHYYNLDQNWAQNNPTPQYAARSFLSLEMLRLMGYPPSVFEIPGGSASDWPPVTSGDALAAYFTNLAYGMKGSNYYIFTGGPNPPGAGSTTDLYDYGAAIGPGGDLRPIYEAQKTFGQWVVSHPDWPIAARRSDMRIGMDFAYARARQYASESGSLFQLSRTQSWDFLRKGVLTTALCAGLSPEFVNLASDDWTTDTTTPLVVVSADSMACDIQQRLVEFLKQGGSLLITPLLPYLDENLQPCTILADFLGHPRQSASPNGLIRARIGSQANVLGNIHPFTSYPESAGIVGVDEISGQPIALGLETPSGGKVLLLGLRWSHAMREHERMLTSLLNGLGLERALVGTNPNVWAVLYRGERRSMLFLLNLLTAPMQTTIHYRASLGGPLVEAGTFTIPPITVQVMDLPEE